MPLRFLPVVLANVDLCNGLERVVIISLLLRREWGNGSL